MENKSINCKQLIIENEELKRSLALSLNKPLIKRLNEAIQRINNGEYISEEDFFRN